MNDQMGNVPTCRVAGQEERPDQCPRTVEVHPVEQHRGVTKIGMASLTISTCSFKVLTKNSVHEKKDNSPLQDQLKARMQKGFLVDGSPSQQRHEGSNGQACGLGCFGAQRMRLMELDGTSRCHTTDGAVISSLRRKKLVRCSCYLHHHDMP